MTKPQYAGNWRTTAKTAIDASPRCAWCGTTADLCADELVPGKPWLGVRTLCRTDNSRRARGATGPARGARFLRG